MNEIQLKYGCNPNQKPSRIFMEDGSDLPVTVDRKSTRLNSSHNRESRMPSSA